MFYGVVHGLLRTFDQSAHVLRAPRRYARAKLHGLGIATGSDALPPRRFADRDWIAGSDNARQPKKAGSGDFVVLRQDAPPFVIE